MCKATFLSFAALDGMNLPESLSETIGEILAGWTRRTWDLAFENEQVIADDVDDSVSLTQLALRYAEVDKAVKAIDVESEDEW